MNVDRRLWLVLPGSNNHSCGKIGFQKHAYHWGLLKHRLYMYTLVIERVYISYAHIYIYTFISFSLSRIDRLVLPQDLHFIMHTRNSHLFCVFFRFRCDYLCGVIYSAVGDCLKTKNLSKTACSSIKVLMEVFKYCILPGHRYQISGYGILLPCIPSCIIIKLTGIYLLYTYSILSLEN